MMVHEGDITVARREVRRVDIVFQQHRNAVQRPLQLAGFRPSASSSAPTRRCACMDASIGFVLHPTVLSA
jgi:hypothetical protein